MLRALYRMLLYTCPTAVRRQEGREMEDGFLHCVDTERTRRGRIGLWLMYGRGIGDLLVFAVRAHWHGWGSGDTHQTRQRRALM